MSNDEEEPGSQVNLDDYRPIEVAPLAQPVQSFDGSGPRLIITHIVNENFKSYAGKRTLGPFHKSFTCIIGPNGSGKSNVIDSMLFVFGYRANKIRSKRLSVLIHNSDLLRNLQSCTVEVHFQKIIDTGPEENDFEVVPDSKLVVSRTAYRDNTSVYHVDGRRITSKEVAILLKGHGIDLDHNRFLILQGEVEQIALMKPKAPTEHEDGLLEYLEDIIGSSRFKGPLERLAGRLETLNEERQEKLNRVKAVEKEKAALEEVKNEALEYLRLNNEIVRKTNMLFQGYLLESKSNEEIAQEKKSQVEASLATLLEQVKAVLDKKEAKIQKNKEVAVEYEQLTKAYRESKDHFAELEAEDGRLRDEYKHLKLTGKKLTKQLETERQKAEELRQAPEEAQNRIDELTNKLAKLDEEKKKEEANFQEAMSSLKEETRELQKSKEEKEAALRKLQSEVDEKRSFLELSRSELNLLVSNHNKEKRRLDDATARQKMIDGKLEERGKALKALKEEVPRMEKALGQARKDLAAVQSKETALGQEVHQIRVKVEESKSAFQANRSQNKVLTALMEQSRTGKIPGILGRLGDLGAIEARYDVAISTACGTLDHIVTDTIDTAQKCVQFLKHYNIGHGNFIGLNKMEKWRSKASQTIQTPENAPRLFDLVQVKDDRVRNAFYFALRDTLVAENLDQATRIAYGARRYRVVTLEGQLIELSGAMTGGGNRVMRGRMGQQLRGRDEEVDPQEVERLERTLASKAQEAEKVKESRLRLEETAARFDTDLKHSRKNLNHFQTEMSGMENQSKSVVEEIAQLEKRVEQTLPDPERVSDLEDKVSKLTAHHTKVADKAAQLKTEVDGLHKDIMDIGGAKLGTVQSRLNAVNSSIGQLTGQLTKINVSIKTAMRNLEKSVQRAASLEKEIEETKARLAEVSETLKKLEKDAADTMTLFQDAQNKVDQIQKAVDTKKAEISELEKEEQELHKTQQEIQHSLDRVKEQVEANSNKVRHWKKMIDKLKLHRMEEEDPDSSQADLSQESLGDKYKLPTYTPEELQELAVSQVDITELQDRLNAMKPNMAAIEEYRRKEGVYLSRVGELEKVTNLRGEQRRQQDQFRKQRLEEFMAGFNTITGRLKEMYQMITLGGDAELELVDSLDPFSEGIVFSVRPPKKSWKNISNLSGGEKTLSSLALVFALHHYKPTPLYVMDEIDAALDFKNVSIVANYVKDRTKNAQFVIISLRSNMFELADRLVGIYKTHNCTKSVTINPRHLQLTVSVTVPAPGTGDAEARMRASQSQESTASQQHHQPTESLSQESAPSEQRQDNMASQSQESMTSEQHQQPTELLSQESTPSEQRQDNMASQAQESMTSECQEARTSSRQESSASVIAVDADESATLHETKEEPMEVEDQEPVTQIDSVESSQQSVTA